MKYKFPNKKAPGKGGHHLAPFYPLTHPGYARMRSVVDRVYASVRALLNLAEKQQLLDNRGDVPLMGPVRASEDARTGVKGVSKRAKLSKMKS